MTDSYVEQLIINKFLGIQSVTSIANCNKYFQDNKNEEEKLEAFKYWDPHKYADDYDDLDKTEQAKIDGPLIYFNEDSLIRWYCDLYPNIFETTDEYDVDDEYGLFEVRGVYEELRDNGMLTGSPENDELYKAIRAVIVERPVDKTVEKKLALYDTEGKKQYIHVYPVVFENLTSERTEVSEGFTKAWYEIYFNPAPPTEGELMQGARFWWTGFVQINICVPVNTGTDDIRERYNEIAEAFKPKLIHQGVRILKTYRASNFNEDDFIWCPVTIDWKAYIET